MLTSNSGHDELRSFVQKLYRDCMEKEKDDNEIENHNLTTITISDNIIESIDNGTNLLYCPSRFDGYLCWPTTQAGTIITQNCPSFVEGFDKNLKAHKTCLANGSWYVHSESNIEWSNYTQCIDYEDLKFREMINDLYIKGYSLSLVSLVISLMIFLGFRTLRCTRIKIHIHLFCSLLLTCGLWIFWYTFFIQNLENIIRYPIGCVILQSLLHYMMLANYFWMFCEGVHLHLVLVIVFVKDNVAMNWFIVIGWFFPLIVLSLYITLRLYEEGVSQCWLEDSEAQWILSVPVIISLSSSFVFLMNVVRVLLRKFKGNQNYSRQPARGLRKAVRATIILIPLFGLQHFLLPYRPSKGSRFELAYQISSVFLISLQGFCVSCLFCFANHDVILAIRILLCKFFPILNQSATRSTNTGQIATQTSSREVAV